MKSPKLPRIRKTILLLFQRAVFRQGIRINEKYTMSRAANYLLTSGRVAAMYLLLFSRVKLPLAIVPVRGHIMHLDPMDALHLSVSGYHEPLVTELLERRIQKGDVVLDIGAHIGYHTLNCARAVGRAGKVYAFEPAPENFSLLRENTERNGYQNVVLERKAVSDKSGRIRLYLSEFSSGDHRTYPPPGDRRSIEVEAVRLDDRFEDERVDLIKIDIQGTEADAIRGASGLLRKNDKVDVVTEFWPAGLRGHGVEPEGFLSLLLEQGFQIYNIDDKLGRIERTSTEKLFERFPPGSWGWTDLLCTRDPEGV